MAALAASERNYRPPRPAEIALLNSPISMDNLFILKLRTGTLLIPAEGPVAADIATAFSTEVTPDGLDFKWAINQFTGYDFPTSKNVNMPSKSPLWDFKAQKLVIAQFLLLQLHHHSCITMRRTRLTRATLVIL